MPENKSLKRIDYKKQKTSLKKYSKGNKRLKKNKKSKDKSKKDENCKLAFSKFEGSMHNSKYDMPIEDALIKLLNTPFAPKTVQPTNDYYTYINDESGNNDKKRR